MKAAADKDYRHVLITYSTVKKNQHLKIPSKGKTDLFHPHIYFKIL